jgi:hypothetical protein
VTRENEWHDYVLDPSDEVVKTEMGKEVARKKKKQDQDMKRRRKFWDKQPNAYRREVTGRLF